MLYRTLSEGVIVTAQAIIIPHARNVDINSGLSCNADGLGIWHSMLEVEAGTKNGGLNDGGPSVREHYGPRYLYCVLI